VHHTILIAHARRSEYLRLCLESLARSAAVCGLVPGDLEVLVLDHSGLGAVPGTLRAIHPAIRVLPDTAPVGEVFNKSRQLNRGLRLAAGEIVTVLDCDMIAGPRFLSCVRSLKDPLITRVCYRVRRLAEKQTLSLLACDSPAMVEAQLTALRANHAAIAALPCEFEGWRFPDRGRQEPAEQPWGNSQFSMRREDLAGLAFDEELAEGHGFEDVDFNRQVYERFGEKYRGRFYGGADHSLLHLHHGPVAGWDDPARSQANLARYRAKWDHRAADGSPLAPRRFAHP